MKPKKKRKKSAHKLSKYQQKVNIPLSFDQFVGGLMKVNPEDLDKTGDASGGDASSDGGIRRDDVKD